MKRLIFCVLLGIAPLACANYTPITPAQLVERGTHRYANVTVEKATQGCATALATLGYKVTVTEAQSGVVKTAPLAFTATATTKASAQKDPLTGNVSAHAETEMTQDGLAWRVAVEGTGADVIVRLTPRAYRNGSEITEGEIWIAEVMDAKFRDVWREVDAAVGAPHP